MELEIRTSDGTLIGKIKGLSAIGIAAKLPLDEGFDREVKKFKGKGASVCFVAKGTTIIGCNDTEIWLEANDYVRVNL